MDDSHSVSMPCADGTDRKCSKWLQAAECSDSFYSLTPEQKDNVREEISQAYKNGELEHGDDFETEIDNIMVIVTPDTCGHCGSDYTRDDNGNIID